MNIAVKMDAKLVARMLERVPAELKAQSDVFIDRVGARLERNAKYAMKANVAGPKQARSRTGNLARHIFYHEPSQQLEAHANYSKYVHGAPFYKFKKPRKTNPFFTTAITNTETFIKAEARAMLKRVVK